MALSGAIGAFIGSFLTDLVSVVALLSIIIIVVSYEAIDLMIKSGKVGQKIKKNRNANPVAYSTSIAALNKGMN